MGKMHVVSFFQVVEPLLFPQQRQTRLDVLLGSAPRPRNDWSKDGGDKSSALSSCPTQQFERQACVLRR